MALSAWLLIKPFFDKKTLKVKRKALLLFLYGVCMLGFVVAVGVYPYAFANIPEECLNLPTLRQVIPDDFPSVAMRIATQHCDEWLYRNNFLWFIVLGALVFVTVALIMLIHAKKLLKLEKQ